jgi:hypothetical protein
MKRDPAQEEIYWGKTWMLPFAVSHAKYAYNVLLLDDSGKSRKT